VFAADSSVLAIQLKLGGAKTTPCKGLGFRGALMLSVSRMLQQQPRVVQVLWHGCRFPCAGRALHVQSFSGIYLARECGRCRSGSTAGADGCFGAAAAPSSTRVPG
jgi:hypothetical protein